MATNEIAEIEFEADGPDGLEIEGEMVYEITPIDRLVSFLNTNNVARLLEEDDLLKIADQVRRDYSEDLDSMEEWIDIVQRGRELGKQEYGPRSDPWDNAANFKSPVIMNAILAFGDTASQELLRKPDIVKEQIIGADYNGMKEAQGKRVSHYLNYQINVKQPEWRTEHDKLLYTLPSTGCMFKKTFRDESLNRNVSDVIYYPNFVVNQSNTTIEDARSFTHVMQFTENEVIEKQRMGIWLDVELHVKDENIEVDADDNPDRFLEQYGWFDLDGDGYKEPYIVTVHEKTSQVLRIVPRYMMEEVSVRVNTGDIISLSDFNMIKESDITLPLEIDEIVFIKPLNLLTKYDFLPDSEGNFLGIGYPHLLCSVTQSINTTTNQLLDAGKLANLPGGYLAKGVRKKLGNDRFQPGEWKDTNVPPRDLSSAFFPLPFKEPSQTLFALNEKLQQEAEKTAANADLSKVLSTNAPATTTLALMQKETQSTTSIIRRIYLAMSEEFKKMALLNSRFGDPEMYVMETGDEQADIRADFDMTNINLVPVANPEMSTRIERAKSGEIQMQFLPQIIEAGGQSQVVISNFLDSLGVENISQIFPQPQPEQIEKQNQLMEQQNQIQQFQNELFDRELAVREADVERKIAETQSKIAETRAKIIEINTNSILNLEKAETEAGKAQLEIYSRELDSLTKLLDGLNRQRGKNEQNANLG